MTVEVDSSEVQQGGIIGRGHNRYQIPLRNDGRLSVVKNFTFLQQVLLRRNGRLSTQFHFLQPWQEMLVFPLYPAIIIAD